MSMDEPRRVGTDADLFPDHLGIAASRGVPRADIVKADLVLSALRAAGLKVPFGADMDDAEEVWGVKLARYSTPTLMRAVDEWISSDTHEFPAVGEFDSVCSGLEREERRQEAIQRGLDNRHPDQTCPTCDDDKFVEVEGQEHSAAKPCPSCRPEQHEIWSGGHHNKEHVRAGGCKVCAPTKRAFA